MTATLRALFWSSRPLSWINTAFPFAAAYILTAASAPRVDADASGAYVPLAGLLSGSGGGSSLTVTFTDVNFSKVGDAFDDAGNLKEEKYVGRVAGFLNELVWMSRVLRYGRENIPPL